MHPPWPWGLSMGSALLGGTVLREEGLAEDSLVCVPDRERREVQNWPRTGQPTARPAPLDTGACRFISGYT